MRDTPQIIINIEVHRVGKERERLLQLIIKGIKKLKLRVKLTLEVNRIFC